MRGREGQDGVLGKKRAEGLGGERKSMKECVRIFVEKKGHRGNETDCL